MTVEISVQRVKPQLIAAVHRPVRLGGVAAACMPALDLVWAFLREHPGLRGPEGHNLFLYRHAETMDQPMQVDFGVQVLRDFEPAGEVAPVWTPAGEVAMAVHRGPYDSLSQTHQAIHAWAPANGRRIGGWSWEIYGDWTDDPAQLETTVVYLLSAA